MKIKNFKEGFIGGIGWSFGVTVGFSLISILLVGILNIFGGLPVIGSFIATVVEATNTSLITR